VVTETQNRVRSSPYLFPGSEKGQECLSCCVF
jgi:hypothetical protein